jgi:hypothetical protein
LRELKKEQRTPHAFFRKILGAKRSWKLRSFYHSLLGSKMIWQTLPSVVALMQEGDDERVRHDYRDHASNTEAFQEIIPAGLVGFGLLPHLANGRGTEQPFPVKLHCMLEKAEKEMNSIVSWQPHGRCFIVNQQDEFVERILKR